MPELKRTMQLFHGSYCAVAAPDLSKCARFKDFGRGFYLTSSEEQARSFARISTRKAIENGQIPAQDYGVVSTFICTDPSPLQIMDYPAADADWLHCVVGHRKSHTFPELVQRLQPYDVISGKIANDRTNATITAYMLGTFGEINTADADRICISLLIPDRLQDQFCFRTLKALAALTFKRSEKVWL